MATFYAKNVPFDKLNLKLIQNITIKLSLSPSKFSNEIIRVSCFAKQNVASDYTLMKYIIIHIVIRNLSITENLTLYISSGHVFSYLYVMNYSVIL